MFLKYTTKNLNEKLCVGIFAMFFCAFQQKRKMRNDTNSALEPLLCHCHNGSVAPLKDGNLVGPVLNFKLH